LAAATNGQPTLPIVQRTDTRWLRSVRRVMLRHQACNEVKTVFCVVSFAANGGVAQAYRGRAQSKKCHFSVLHILNQLQSHHQPEVPCTTLPTFTGNITPPSAGWSSISSPATSVTTYRTTWRYNPDNHSPRRFYNFRLRAYKLPQVLFRLEVSRSYLIVYIFNMWNASKQFHFLFNQ
jgi:hypothetical protein